MDRSGSFSPHLRPDAPAPDPDRGVFETMLVVDGAPLELEAHLARLDASVRALYGASVPEAAAAALREHAEALTLGRARVTVAPADGGGLSVAATSAAIARELVLPGIDAGVTLEPVVVADWQGAHKWADRRLLEAAEATCAPARPLLVDAAGDVLETSRANVAALVDGVLVTPPADGRVLPGVTRARVLELARAAGLPVSERPLGLDELLDAEEVLLTGAVRGIEAVAACAGGPGWLEAPVTAALAAALGDAWRIPPSRGA